MIADALLSRLLAGTSLALAVALVSTCAVDSTKIRNRDAEIARYKDRIENTDTGYIALLGRCGAERIQLQSDLDAQNEKVAELWALGDASTKAAQAAVDAAQKAQASAERRAAQIQAQQPAPGEDHCAAAVRVIQESAR